MTLTHVVLWWSSLAVDIWLKARLHKIPIQSIRQKLGKCHSMRYLDPLWSNVLSLPTLTYRLLGTECRTTRATQYEVIHEPEGAKDVLTHFIHKHSKKLLEMICINIWSNIICFDTWLQMQFPSSTIKWYEFSTQNVIDKIPAWFWPGQKPEANMAHGWKHVSKAGMYIKLNNTTSTF